MATLNGTITPAPPIRKQTQLGLFWLRFSRQKLAVFALTIIALELLVAVLAPVISPYNPAFSDWTAVWALPGGKHFLGTDDLGRDVLSRLIYGSQVSLSIGILSQITIVVIGLPIGAISGLVGGKLDFAIMRVIDVLSSVPTILLYILLMVALGAGFGNIIIAMAVTGWIGIARLVRGQVLSLKETDYVRAARAMGGSTRHIVFTHLVRNSLTPIIVSMALGVPGAMFAEAGLSFLGLGVVPPTTSWGQMIGLYQGFIQSYWHLTVFPAITLAVTMLVWILLGDGLQNALDPTRRI